MKRGTGILLNEAYDLTIVVRRNTNGFISQGMMVGRTTLQNQALLLGLHKGELKHAPSVGVGISSAILDHDLPYWRQRIRQELENDGLRIKELVFSNPEELTIDADY